MYLNTHPNNNVNPEYIKISNNPFNSSLSKSSILFLIFKIYSISSLKNKALKAYIAIITKEIYIIFLIFSVSLIVL